MQQVSHDSHFVAGSIIENVRIIKSHIRHLKILKDKFSY